MCHPVEMAAVHNAAAHSRAVAVHILGGGMGHDICAPLKRAAVDGRGEGVVHDQGHAVGMGCLCKLFNVQNSQGRVGNGFAKHGLGVGLKGGIQLFLGGGGGHKGHINAHFAHGHIDQVKSAAVNAAGGHNVIAAVANVEQCIEIGCLAAACQHGRRAALQRTDLGRHHIVGGVLQTGVKIAAGLQVKQLGHILAGIIFKGSALHNGDLAGLAVAGGVAALHANAVDFHILSYFPVQI